MAEQEMAEQETAEQEQRRRGIQSRAKDLTNRSNDADRAHEGNRVTADEDAPQPTREPTRDQRA